MRKEFLSAFCVICSTVPWGCCCKVPLCSQRCLFCLNERLETFVNHEYFHTGQEKHFLASLKCTPRLEVNSDSKILYKHQKWRKQALLSHFYRWQTGANFEKLTWDDESMQHFVGCQGLSKATPDSHIEELGHAPAYLMSFVSVDTCQSLIPYGQQTGKLLGALCLQLASYLPTRCSMHAPVTEFEPKSHSSAFPCKQPSHCYG